MMTKALGLNVGFYGYDPNGASVSALPAGNAHPETNLCYGLLETWLRACSRPSVMLQTAARVGNASNASRAAAARARTTAPTATATATAATAAATNPRSTPRR